MKDGAAPGRARWSRVEQGERNSERPPKGVGLPGLHEERAFGTEGSREVWQVRLRPVRHVLSACGGTAITAANSAGEGSKRVGRFADRLDELGLPCLLVYVSYA